MLYSRRLAWLMLLQYVNNPIFVSDQEILLDSRLKFAELLSIASTVVTLPQVMMCKGIDID